MRLILSLVPLLFLLSLAIGSPSFAQEAPKRLYFDEEGNRLPEDLERAINERIERQRQKGWALCILEHLDKAQTEPASFLLEDACEILVDQAIEEQRHEIRKQVEGNR